MLETAFVHAFYDESFKPLLAALSSLDGLVCLAEFIYRYCMEEAAA